MLSWMQKFVKIFTNFGEILTKFWQNYAKFRQNSTIRYRWGQALTTLVYDYGSFGIVRIFPLRRPRASMRRGPALPRLHKMMGHDTSLFRRLVLGWINADFRVQIRILQHFSRSSRKSSRKQICKNFRNFTEFCKIFENFLWIFRKNAKFWKLLQKFCRIFPEFCKIL